MKVLSLSYLYQPDGRLQGSYVYMLLCPDGEIVHIKIGQSSAPIARMLQLRRKAPTPAEQFCLVETSALAQARALEYALHCACAEWRMDHRRDWFSVPMTDKVDFRTRCTEVVDLFREPNWPMEWNWVDVPAYLAYGRRLAARKQRILARYGGLERYAACERLDISGLKA